MKAFRSIISKVKAFLAERKMDKELTDAVLVAEQLYRTHNRRFYVIPDNNHKLRVFSWSQLKQMKKQGLFSSNCKENDFINESFYYTPSRIDGMYMKPELKEKKRKMWHTYYKAYRL